MEHDKVAGLYNLLQRLNIHYEPFHHDAVFTCKESENLGIEMPGAHTKQLLMRDKKGIRNILAIVMHDKKVDMRAFGRMIAAKNLSFASPARLWRLLNVFPGAVSPFGLIFDKNHEVEVMMDEDAWKIGLFRFHPLTNTSTLVVDKNGFEKFLKHTGHEFKIIAIPARKPAS